MNDPRCPPKVIDLLDPTFLVLQEVFASQNKILPVPIPGIPPFNPALIKNFWDADAELPVINGDFELALNMHHFFAGPDAQRDADSQIAVNPPSQIASSSAVSTAQDVMNSPSRSPVSSASSSPYPASDYSADPPSRQMAPAHDHDCGSHEAQTPESGYASFSSSPVPRASPAPAARVAGARRTQRRTRTPRATPYDRLPRAESPPEASSSQETLDEVVPAVGRGLPEVVTCRLPDCPLPDRRLRRDVATVGEHINRHRDTIRAQLELIHSEENDVTGIPFRCSWEGCEDHPKYKDKTFTLRSIQRHLEIHFQVDCYMCLKCGNWFSRKDSSPRHRKSCDRQLKKKLEAEEKGKEKGKGKGRAQDATARWRYDC